MTDRFDAAMDRSATLHDVLAEDFPDQAAYAVALAYRAAELIRFDGMHYRTDIGADTLTVLAGGRGVPD